MPWAMSRLQWWSSIRRQNQWPTVKFYLLVLVGDLVLLLAQGLP